MQITVRDILHIEQLKSLKLIAGAGGLDNVVTKVGILDYEFTRRGAAFCTEDHWQQGEFVLTTFVYAKDNSSLMLDAVKRLRSMKTSGLAIKNVYGLELPREIVRYADEHHYPVLVFTDNSLFFERAIVEVDRFQLAMSDQDRIEKSISSLLNENYESGVIKQQAISINYAFSNHFIVAYCIPKADIYPQKLRMLLADSNRSKNRSETIAKYQDGFFYILSLESGENQPSPDVLQTLAQSAGLNIDDYHIGISKPQFFLEYFKKAMLQSYYTATYCRVTGQNSSEYSRLGVYGLLLPHINDEYCEEYYDVIIRPIIFYDEKNKADLLVTALLYEECHGNIKEVASRLCTHENTIRYRLKKTVEIIGMTEADEHFSEELCLAAKIYRIRKAQADHLR